MSGAIVLPDDFAVTTFSAPAGSPASSRICASMSIDSGVCFAGLMTDVQPAAIAGPILRVPIAMREVPRRDEEARADRPGA